jgi:hypothetical protein
MNAAPVAQAEANEAGRPGPAPGAEVLMTGTDGARVLLFSRPAATGSSPEFATGSSIRSTFTATVAGARFKRLAARVVWRPKTAVKNADYPSVTAPGCYFKSDSGGFALIRRATNKYLGHYTRNTIAELERQYGKIKRTNSR